MATKPAPVKLPESPAPVVNPAVITGRQDSLLLARAGITNGMTQDQIDAKIAATLGVPVTV